MGHWQFAFQHTYAHTTRFHFQLACFLVFTHTHTHTHTIYACAPASPCFSALDKTAKNSFPDSQNFESVVCETESVWPLLTDPFLSRGEVFSVSTPAGILCRMVQRPLQALGVWLGETAVDHAIDLLCFHHSPVLTLYQYHGLLQINAIGRDTVFTPPHPVLTLYQYHGLLQINATGRDTVFTPPHPVLTLYQYHGLLQINAIGRDTVFHFIQQLVTILNGTCGGEGDQCLYESAFSFR